MNRRCLVVLLLGLVGTPVEVRAQAVVGRVTASESGAPLAGAFVRLLDHTGRQMRGVLTDAMGQYRLDAPGYGRYRVRAEFIGRTDSEMGLVELRAGLTVDWSPGLLARPVELDPIEVRGSPRCAMPSEEGSRTAEVWSEARKALGIAAWAADQDLFRYEINSYRREWNRERERILEEHTTRREGVFRDPFLGRPAQDLMAAGFVQERDGDTFVYAPDAGVLLSDAFLDGHCLLLAGAEGDSVGLRFEPTRERQVPDIQGVMWLDREATQLRSVVFTYRRFPEVGRDLRLGGRLDFERLPTGAWFIRRWSVEMPIWADVLQPGTTDRWDRRVVGIMEEGAEVLTVLDGSGTAAFVADRATLAGSLHDSIRGGPLVGAAVSVAGTAYSATSGPDGAFHLPDLPEGRFLITIAHPRLDSLGIQIGHLPVDLVAGKATTVFAAVPRSVSTGRTENTSVRGEALDASTRVGIQGARVSLVGLSGATDTVTTDGAGAYELRVGEPGQYRVHVEVTGRGALTSESCLVGDGERVFHSFVFDAHVADSAEARRGGVSSTPLDASEAGSGIRVVGSVEARESSRPLPDVSVRIADRPAVLSDSRGRFRMEGLQAGRVPIEVVFLGREPIQDTLVLEGEALVEVRVVLSEAPIELDPLLIEVDPLSLTLDRAGFYDRRDRSGISSWRLTREEIERRPGARLSDLVSNIPSTFLLHPGYPAGAAILRMNRPGNEFRVLQAKPMPGCEPVVYVDGLEYFDSAVDYPRVRDLNFLSPTSMEGIEVYTGLTAPAQFRTNGCGVILIWTRGGAPPDSGRGPPARPQV